MQALSTLPSFSYMHQHPDDDSEVEEFYRELQSLVDQTPKQGIFDLAIK